MTIICDNLLEFADIIRRCESQRASGVSCDGCLLLNACHTDEAEGEIERVIHVRGYYDREVKDDE